MTHLYSGIASRGPIKARAEIHSFKDAERFLNGARVRTIAANTFIESVSTCGVPDCKACRIDVVLYDTPILRYFRDGFEADNGGFNTPTTSARLNQFGPEGFYFFHKDKKLYVSNPDHERSVCGPGIRFSY